MCSCVVPSVLYAIEKASKRYLNQTAFVITKGIKTGMRICRTVAADRCRSHCERCGWLSSVSPNAGRCRFWNGDHAGLCECQRRILGRSISPGFGALMHSLLKTVG